VPRSVLQAQAGTTARNNGADMGITREGAMTIDDIAAPTVPEPCAAKEHAHTAHPYAVQAAPELTSPGLGIACPQLITVGRWASV
jgi:hypothetical protein